MNIFAVNGSNGKFTRDPRYQIPTSLEQGILTGVRDGNVQQLMETVEIYADKGGHLNQVRDPYLDWSVWHFAATRTEKRSTQPSNDPRLIFNFLFQQWPQGIHISSSRSGHTPLHVAVFSGSGLASDFLLSHGADRDAWDRNGLTPLDMLNTFPYRDVKTAFEQLRSFPIPSAGSAAEYLLHENGHNLRAPHLTPANASIKL